MTPEFSRPVALARIPPEGRQERLRATPSECAALALRFGIPAVNRFAAELVLKPEPGGGVAITGRILAEVVQDCVVTLEPVVQQVEEAVHLRILGPGEAHSDDPEAPDDVDAAGGVADLGEALAEQLALALDPYPRAPGAVLPEEVAGEEPEASPEPPASPFAGLAALRGRK
ncbi:YceD family protein [Roseomonas sp. CAU 1739]|uniref:YceD family protein n=1 Tax=Roseomonas sp. CAU 1739 TaxID=3140364 RepID=UPI00325AFD89